MRFGGEFGKMKGEAGDEYKEKYRFCEVCRMGQLSSVICSERK